MTSSLNCSSPGAVEFWLRREESIIGRERKKHKAILQQPWPDPSHISFAGGLGF